MDLKHQQELLRTTSSKGKINIVKKILSGTLLLTLCIAVFLIVLTSFLPFKKVQILKVISGSMAPEIPVGSLVVIKKIDPSLIKVGNVINFISQQNSNVTITHRVIDIKNEDRDLIFITKGDANNSQDSDPVKTNQIKGVEILHIPLLGYISNWIKTPVGFILLIIVPGIFIMVNEIISIIKTIEESVKKKYGLKIILIPLLFFSGFGFIRPTNSYFADTHLVGDNVFSTGYWLPPNTDITNSTFSTQSEKDITVSYVYDYDENLDYVQLCYSFNLSDFICPDNDNFRNKSGFFDFIAEKDGIYKFYTLSKTTDGLVENINRTGKTIIKVQVDSVPPTSNFSYSNLPSNIWSGANLVKNGTFKQGDYGWVSSGSGEHHVVYDEENKKDVFLLGYKNLLPSSLDETSIYQTVFLPQNSVSNLSFKYRLFSNDAADYSNFSVQIRSLNNQVLNTILLTGNTNIGTSFDSGWQSIGRSILSAYNNQNVNLWFGVNNMQPNNNRQTWVYLDDIKISVIDPRIGETFPAQIKTADIGSGIFSQSTLPDLAVGENNLTFNSIDYAFNEESSKKQDIIILPSVVLNKIYFSPGLSSVELFNNSLSAINLNGFYLENSFGLTYPVTNTNIGPTGKTIIDIPDVSDFKLNQSQNTIILKSNNQTKDQTTYSSFNLKIYQRSPDGVGSWGFVNLETEYSIDLNLVYRPVSHKVLLSVFDIPSSLNNFNYEIIYTSGLKEKGIYGAINSSEILNSKDDREFFLGTCSEHGACTPDLNLSNLITVKLSKNNTNLITKTFQINP